MLHTMRGILCIIYVIRRQQVAGCHQHLPDIGPDSVQLAKPLPVGRNRTNVGRSCPNLSGVAKIWSLPGKSWPHVWPNSVQLAQVWSKPGKSCPALGQTRSNSPGSGRSRANMGARSRLVAAMPTAQPLYQNACVYAHAQGGLLGIHIHAACEPSRDEPPQNAGAARNESGPLRPTLGRMR